jgi:hypothetical protein
MRCVSMECQLDLSRLAKNILHGGEQAWKDLLLWSANSRKCQLELSRLVKNI